MYTNNITLQAAAGTEVNFFGNANYEIPSESAVRTLAGPAHWELFKYITALSGISLTEQHKSLIIDSVKIKKLRKRQYFLQDGDVCKYIGFIIKGSTRMFSINERGQESIVAFGLESSWVADHASFDTNDCSCYHIEALENTEMLIMTRAQLGSLMAAVPAFAIMYSQYQLQQMIYNQKRINSALSMTAEERYYDLLRCLPQYARRFSQNMLACYLGVKPETLSRIRKNNL